MPKLRSIRPRAPWLTQGRSSCSGRAGRPRSSRQALMALTRSGAVSASVPSRSNSTSSVTRDMLGGTPAGKQVIDAGVAAQGKAARPGVVLHAAYAADLEAAGAHAARQFARTQKARVVVGAARQQAQQILGADDG